MPLAFFAPLSGVLLPLESVPDPVFSGKMVGDGVAIEPTSEKLLAPCDGEVIQLHPAGHALTLRSSDGVEILLHIGIDTVKLKGEGFQPKVSLGQRVRQGDELIFFAADLVACRAKSLISLVVFTNEEQIGWLKTETGKIEAGSSRIAQLELKHDSTRSEAVGSLELASETIVIMNPSGLHARPSAVLASLAKRFEAEIWLQKDDKRTNARSLVGLMSLEVAKGDKVQLVASGVQARAALDAIVPEILAGLGESVVSHLGLEGEALKSQPAAVAQPLFLERRSSDASLLLGVPASPGLVVGRVFQLRQPEIELSDIASEGAEVERDRLKGALRVANLELEAMVARLHAQADPAKATIFAAHQELLDDPDLVDLATSSIAKGLSAAAAWKRAYCLQAERLAGLRNELLAARANDLKDVGRRVLSKMVPGLEQAVEIPLGSVVIAEDLTPSDTANLDPSRVLGFCTTAGGATSHVAILARSMGIPAIAGIEERALEITGGTRAILFGSQGQLKIDPSEELIERVSEAQKRAEARRKVQVEAARAPALTTDGHRVAVGANIGGAAEVMGALELGAEGIGLLRSEFLFLERAFAPTEEDQFQSYSQIAQGLGPDRVLVVRTLDVGGDKPLAYLPIPKEDNPFLGQRGVRVCLSRPDIFRPQIRAVIRASAYARVHVMFPMVTSISELRACRDAVREEEAKLGLGPIPIGVMIEVPAAALCAHVLAKEVDFFSIGTNDLTQYTLAMDRGHPQLAAKIDALSPAVLRLIKITADAARKEGKWVGVCGGAAGELQAVPILIGLGVSELSVSIPLIPAVKACIREYSLAQCQELAAAALAMEEASQVRGLCPDPLLDEVRL